MNWYLLVTKEAIWKWNEKYDKCGRKNNWVKIVTLIITWYLSHEFCLWDWWNTTINLSLVQSVNSL